MEGELIFMMNRLLLLVTFDEVAQCNFHTRYEEWWSYEKKLDSHKRRSSEDHRNHTKCSHTPAWGGCPRSTRCYVLTRRELLRVQSFALEIHALCVCVLMLYSLGTLENTVCLKKQETSEGKRKLRRMATF